MTARILVVDDVEPNVRLLEAKLTLEYYEVLTAHDGLTALEIASAERPDIILLDVMMPGMDGFETCRRLKSDPATSHIPVVMVTALDHVSDRIRGLEAGADDFLTKPVNDLQLMTRVRSLVRLKMLTDELRLRASTTRNIGIEELLSGRQPASEAVPRVLLIDERQASGARIARMLGKTAKVDVGLCDAHQQRRQLMTGLGLALVGLGMAGIFGAIWAEIPEIMFGGLFVLLAGVIPLVLAAVLRPVLITDTHGHYKGASEAFLASLR